MSAGTRSRAMTAAAPASSAMRALTRLVSGDECGLLGACEARAAYLLCVHNIHNHAVLEHPCKVRSSRVSCSGVPIDCVAIAVAILHF